MHKATSSLAVALLLCGCGRAPGSVPPTEDRAAIVGGTVDAVDTSVVAILVELPGGSGYLCTGSVIGPHSVVTAGHCAADFTAGAQGSVITDGVLGPNPAFVARIDRFEPHPQYHQAQGAGDWSDIGMAHTVEALPGPYLPLNRYPLDRLQLEGQPVIDVGYGTIGADAGGSGVRRSVVKHDVTVRSAGELQEGPNDGLTCNGDSGGPSFFTTPDGLSSIIGVTSRGDDACVQISVETRVDAYLDFISGFMADAGDPPDCGADGRCGFHCAAPDPDCPCAPDGLCTSACPTPEADPDCTQSCLFDGGSCLGQHASTSGSSGSGTGSDDSGCNAAGGIGLAAWLILGIGLALTRRRG